MWKEIRDNHMGKLLGLLIGGLHGFIYLYFGFWDMLFFALVAFTGFHIGRKFDRKEKKLWDWRPFFNWLTERWQMFK